MALIQRKGRKYVRQELVWSKITSYPFDLIIWTNEVITSTPWDDYADSIALPGGYLLSLIYLFIIKIGKYNDTGSHHRQNPVFLTDQIDYQKIRSKASGSNSIHTYSSVLFYIINVLGFILLAVSMINTANLFLSYKNYTLLYSNPQHDLNSPSAHKITLTNDSALFSTWDRIFNAIYDRVASRSSMNKNNNKNSSKNNDNSDIDISVDSSYDETTIDEINLIEKEVWELSVWDPSKFRLKLAASFSPVVALFIFTVADELALWKILLIGGLVSFTLQLLTSRFLILLHDKQIMYQQMFSEYNDKFVKPKTSVLRKDVVIDATYGPRAPTVLTVKTDLQAHLQTSTLKVFVTHDINGKPFNNVSVSKKTDPEYERWLFHKEQQQKQAQSQAEQRMLRNTSYLNPLSTFLKKHQPLESPFKSPLRKSDNVYLSTPFRLGNSNFERYGGPHMDIDKSVSERTERIDRSDRSAFYDSSLQYNSDRYDRFQRPASVSPKRQFERTLLRSPQRSPGRTLPVVDLLPQRSPLRSNRIGINELNTPFERESLGSRRLSIRSPSPVKRAWK